MLLELIYGSAQHKTTGLIHNLNAMMENQHADFVYMSILSPVMSDIKLLWTRASDKCPAPRDKAGISVSPAQGGLYAPLVPCSLKDDTVFVALPEAHTKTNSAFISLLLQSPGKRAGT